MEEAETRTFSGDSFGNLDLTNAEQDAETEFAVPNSVEGQRPHFKPNGRAKNRPVEFEDPGVSFVTDNREPSVDNAGSPLERDGELGEQSALSTGKTFTGISVMQKQLHSRTALHDSGVGEKQMHSGTVSHAYVEGKTEDTKETPTLANALAEDQNSENIVQMTSGHDNVNNNDTHMFHGGEDDQAASYIDTSNIQDNVIPQVASEREVSDNNIDLNNNDNETQQEDGTGMIILADPIVENDSEGENEQQSDEVENEEINDNEDAELNDDNVNSENEDGESDCLLLETSTRPQTRSTLREVPGGMRAKANTPASQYTNTVEEPVSPDTPKAVQVDSVRGASRGSRDEVFQRAMTLMSNRCTSARGEQEELFSDREPPFGIHIPQYFYVQQKKPSPMSPLKVWRGYKGNVYFEPINVRRIRSAHGEPYNSPLERLSSEQLSTAAPTTTRGPATPATRATTAGSSQALRSYRYIEPPSSASPQVFVMDKQAVISSLRNSGDAPGGHASRDIQRDLHFIEGMESTGSLAVRPLSGSVVIGNGGGARLLSKIGSHDKKLLFRRDRLCKGPNFSAVDRRRAKDGGGGNDASKGGTSRKTSVHSSILTSPRSSSRISAYRPGSRSAGPGSRPYRASVSFPQNGPDLVVSGDKFAPPTVMSPLLRSAGHFSLGGGAEADDDEGASGHRAAVNSPDLVDARGMMMTMAMSPPLDPLRISLCHTTSPGFDPEGGRTSHTAGGGYRGKAGRGRREGSRPLTCSEELKPFIKYSHDVKMNYERNNVNFC